MGWEWVGDGMGTRWGRVEDSMAWGWGWVQCGLRYSTGMGMAQG